MGDLSEIIACEDTPTGWRALTAYGDLLTIEASTGVPASGSVLTSTGQRLALPAKDHRISDFLAHVEISNERVRALDFTTALAEIDTAIAIFPTTCAKFHRSMVLLAMGHWREGFAGYEAGCPYWRPTLDLPRWQGEPLNGKRIILTYDHGFGDTIMMLRYVPAIRAMGADVRLLMPPQLAAFAAQIAPVCAADERADFYCPLFALMHLLAVTPDNVPQQPYLTVDRERASYWRKRLGNSRPKIGIAWSVGHPHKEDYQRFIALEPLVHALNRHGDLVSIQQQEGDAAHALGVKVFGIADFADLAALISVLDSVVTVDTAAVHVAGAIGHPNVSLLLPYWASWRWLAPWYPQIRFCRQRSAGDWASALAKLQAQL